MATLQMILVYALGFLGLAAFGLVPLRSWQLIRELLPRKRSTANLMTQMSFVLFAAGALVGELQIAARILRCLTTAYCGPGVASGWIYLAMLGAIYASLEAALLLARRAKCRI